MSIDHNKIEDISEFFTGKKKYSSEEIEKQLEEDSDLFNELLAYRDCLAKSDSKIHFDSKHEYKRIHASISKQNRRILIRKISIAASILIIFVSTFYLYRVNKSIETPQIAVIEPQVNVANTKAILTLGDGSEVQLENKNVQISDDNVKGIVNDSIKGLQYNKIQKPQVHKIVYNTLKVPIGGDYSLTLADGTKVILNSDSELRFPVDFTEKNRKVFLKGEAYFDVAHDKKKPFIVSVNKVEIEVLGTEFNVNAYDDESEMYATLVEGAIKFTADGLKKSRVLKPNQQVEFNKQTNISTIQNVDVSEFVSWKDGAFTFKSTSLDRIVKQLKRWYDYKIIFVDDDVRGYRFRGVISKKMELSKILKIIEETSNVKIEIKVKEVYIRK